MVTLAVDDKSIIAQQIAKIMADIDPEGTHLSETDQEKALEAVQEHKPDVVWMDIEMPGMSGLTMAAKVKKLSPDTNIVFVTAFSDYAMDAFGLHVSGYVLKPVSEDKLRTELSNLRNPVTVKDDKVIRVQCFGNFEVFCNGEIMRFSRSLGKEAMAYLIDRRGAGCTVGEICSVLWEDRQADAGLKSQCRVIMAALKKDLAAAGAGDVIVKSWNTWSIDTEKIKCDYFDFLRSDTAAVNEFRGEYMAQYSWAEMTVGSLYDIKEMNISIN